MKTMDSFVADLHTSLTGQRGINSTAIMSTGKEFTSALGNQRISNLESLSNVFFVPEFLVGLFSTIYIFVLRPQLVHIQHEYRWLNHSLVLFAMILISKISGSKLIVTMHSVLYEPSNSNNLGESMSGNISLTKFIKKQYVRFLNRLIVFFSISVLVHSKPDLDRLDRLDASHSKVLELSTLLVPSYNVNSKIVCSSKKTPSEICLVVPGYIEMRKGQDIAIHIIDELLSLGMAAHLHIVGSTQSHDGERFLSKIRRMAGERSERVLLDCRYLTYEELTSYIESADSVLLPYRLKGSTEVIQSNGSAVFSLAVAASKPTIVTAIPYFESILSPKLQCLLFDENQPKAAACIINWIFSSDTILRSLQERIYEIYQQKFSIEQVTNKHMEIYMKA